MFLDDVGRALIVRKKCGKKKQYRNPFVPTHLTEDYACFKKGHLFIANY